MGFGVSVFWVISHSFFYGSLLLLSRFSHVRLCGTPWTAAHQPPLSTGFSREEDWSGLPFPSPIECLNYNNTFSENYEEYK